VEGESQSLRLKPVYAWLSLLPICVRWGGGRSSLKLIRSDRAPYGESSAPIACGTSPISDSASTGFRRDAALKIGYFSRPAK